MGFMATSLGLESQ